MDKKNSFVLYTDYREQLRLLPDDERGRLMMALMDYAADGTVSGILSDAGQMCFAFIRQRMDRDNEKYANICKTRAESGAMGGRPRKADAGEENQVKAKKANGFSEKQKNPDNDNENDSDIDHDTEKESTKKNPRFAPPTLGDVREYCLKSGYNVDAERFIDFYTAKDWMIGKNKMKDWKAAVRNWNRSQRQESTAKAKPNNRFHNLEEHGYDYDRIVWDGIRTGEDGKHDSRKQGS